jgi:putative acetyltransferase
MHQPITLRCGQPSDLPEMKRLFADTITNVCQADYDAAQIAAWVSSTENAERWQAIVTTQVVLIAELEAELERTMVGFASLADGHYLDLLYIHHAHQRKGIANTLYAAIEKEARRAGSVTLISDVSITARPFFEKVGFHALSEQCVRRHGVELINFRMTKALLDSVGHNLKNTNR